MLSSRATSVDEYLSSLPPDRREAIARLRRLILKQLPPGYEESLQFGMIGYAVPLERYPETYNGQPLLFAALASQKQYMSLYLMNVYGQQDREQRLLEAFRAAGKKLDMGKSCIRFKALDDLALDAIAQVIAGTSVSEFIAHYEAARPAAPKKRARPIEKPSLPAKKRARPAKKLSAKRTRATPQAGKKKRART